MKYGFVFISMIIFVWSSSQSFAQDSILDLEDVTEVIDSHGNVYTPADDASAVGIDFEGMTFKNIGKKVCCKCTHVIKDKKTGKPKLVYSVGWSENCRRDNNCDVTSNGACNQKH